jgi:hypothetical protein
MLMMREIELACQIFFRDLLIEYNKSGTANNPKSVPEYG